MNKDLKIELLKEFQEKFIPQNILIEDFGGELAKRDQEMKLFLEQAMGKIGAAEYERGLADGKNGNGTE